MLHSGESLKYKLHVVCTGAGTDTASDTGTGAEVLVYVGVQSAQYRDDMNTVSR